MGDRLRPVWDFDDLEASRERFRALLDEETTDVGRAEVLTQLARVEGLSDRFDEGDQLLDEASALAGSDPLVRARVDLERGRLRRSGGNSEAALPLFEASFETALAIPHEFIAVDAAHMAAIAAPTIADRLAWADRGIEMAQYSSDPEVTTWLGLALQQHRLGLLRRGRVRDRPRLVRASARRAREAARPADAHRARPRSGRGSPAHARGAPGITWTPRQRSHSSGASSRSSRRPALPVSSRWRR